MQQSHFFYEIRVGDILLAKAVGGQLIDHLSQEADNTENGLLFTRQELHEADLH